MDAANAVSGDVEMKDCTCLGTCRGAAGLGTGWRCALDWAGEVRQQERVSIADQANIVKPKDASDQAIRQAALETASRLGLFAKTWPEFYAFGLAVKAVMFDAAPDTRCASTGAACSGSDGGDV